MGHELVQTIKHTKFKLTALSIVLSTALYTSVVYAENLQVNLPAQTLQQSIEQLSRQSNIDIIFAGNIVANQPVPAVYGHLSVEQILQKLLYNTGLSVRKQGNVYTIVPKTVTTSQVVIPSDEAVQLPLITVIAENDQKQTTNTYTVKSSSSATKLDLDIKDTPQMVQVMTRQRIEDQNLTQASDVLKEVPGLTFQQSGATGAGRAEFFARGFRISNSMFDGVSTSGTGFNYMDIWGALDTAIYDRVEVVQGSTGLMTGVGDPSASINFVRKRPVKEAQGEVSVDYGSWNRLRRTFDASLPLNAEGSVRGRLVGAYSTGDSFQDRVESDQKTLYGVLEADVTDKTLLTLGAVYTDLHVDDAQPWGLFEQQLQNGRKFNNATQWSYSDLKMANVFLHADHEFNKNLSANFRYSYTDMDSDRMFGYMSIYEESVQQYYHFFDRLRSDGKIHDIDLSFKSSFELFGQPQQFIIGAGLYKGKMDNPMYNSALWGINDHWLDEWNNGNTAIPISTSAIGMQELMQMLGLNYDLGAKNFLTNNDYARTIAEEEQKSVYFSTNIKPVEHLSIILGGRYNKYERSYSTKEQDFGIFFRGDTPEDILAAEEAWANPPAQLPYLETKGFPIKTSKFVPYAGLVFDITKDITAYASYTGIHKPNVDNYTGHVYRDKDGELLDPIEGDTKEIGVKAALHDNKLNLQLSVYQMKQENMPRTYYDEKGKMVDLGSETGLSNEPARFAQIGDGGRIATGVDTSIAGQINDKWFVFLGYNYTKQETENKKIGKVDNIDRPGTNKDKTNGSYLLGAVYPEHQAKLFTTYNMNDAFKLGFGANYKGGFEQYYESGNRKQGGYTIFDLMAQYKVNKNLNIQANIKNLFDKTYQSSNFAILPESWGATRQQYFWGEPRNYMLSVQYKF